MSDTKALVFAPVWLKVVTVALLALSLIFSGYIAYHFMAEPSRASHMLAALTIAQMSISGLFLSMVLFFTSRTVGVRELSSKSARFLEKELPDVLSRMDYADVFGPEELYAVRVRTTHRSGALFATYRIEIGDLELTIRLQFNVHRLLIIPNIPVTYFGTLDRLKSRMDIPVFDGLRRVGYETSYAEECSDRDGQSYHLIRLYQPPASPDFLLDARERLYWMQDVSLMIRAIMIEMARCR